jgi:proline iminopeptidase
LLFIHGGPGQSCYDFMQVQGDRLARRLRIIGVDQRGTLRSDPLPAEPALTPELLIADFEALRKNLEIASWAVLGHSDGGGYALQYVTSHPETVQAAIFDCSCWDADLTDRNRLPQVPRKLEALGQQADAERCRKLAAKPSRLTAADETYLAAQTLGPHYMELYFHDPGCAADFSQILDESGFAVVTLTWPDGVAQMARPGTVPRISHATERLAPEGWVIDHVIRRSGRAVQDRSLRSVRWADVPHLSAPGPMSLPGPPWTAPHGSEL